MKTARNVRLVLVTTPDRKTARALARAALEARLVVCANLVPGIESHYRWKGRLEKSSEILVLFKTTQTKSPHLRSSFSNNTRTTPPR